MDDRKVLSKVLLSREARRIPETSMPVIVGRRCCQYDPVNQNDGAGAMTTPFAVCISCSLARRNYSGGASAEHAYYLSPSGLRLEARDTPLMSNLDRPNVGKPIVDVKGENESSVQRGGQKDAGGRYLIMSWTMAILWWV